MTARTAVPLPPQELRFMHEDDVQVVAVGSRLANTVRSFGVPDDARLLDVGCGYGRLAIGLAETGFQGEYLGFDILAKHTRWCAENITPASGGRYEFRHLDVKNGRYNPAGEISPVDVEFPAETRSRDAVTLFSVFTHMYEADIRRYLNEIHRVLDDGGRAVTSWFVYDDARLAAATDPARTRFPMTNQINAVTRYNEPNDPLRAIAYDEARVRRMIRDADLAVEQVQYGYWCGDKSPEFQDIFVVQRMSPSAFVSALRPPVSFPTASHEQGEIMGQFRTTTAEDVAKKAKRLAESEGYTWGDLTPERRQEFKQRIRNER